MHDEIIEISPHKIRINPYQPRRYFNQEELEELAASLKAVGLLHPPVVRRIDEEGTFELIAGERRLRAAALAGMEKIPVLVRLADACVSAQAALLENLQRSDLNSIEVAKAMQNLLRDFSFTQEQLTEKLGKKRSTIANYVRLLSLPHAIQEAVAGGSISMGHAKIILSLESLDDQQKLFEAILKKKMTVRRAELMAKNISHKNPYVHPQSGCQHFSEVHALRRTLESHLGTKVQLIYREGGKGSILLEFFSEDDLQRLLEILGVPKPPL